MARVPRPPKRRTGAASGAAKKKLKGWAAGKNRHKGWGHKPKQAG